MERYKNKRVMLRSGGKFRKAVPADMGIGGVCPVCRHLLLQHYDGEDTQHPDPRLFRYRCFTCEPLTEAEKKASDEKFAYQPSKFSIEDFFKVGEFSKTETPPNTACTGLATPSASESNLAQNANQ